MGRMLPLEVVRAMDEGTQRCFLRTYRDHVIYSNLAKRWWEVYTACTHAKGTGHTWRWKQIGPVRGFERLVVLVLVLGKSAGPKPNESFPCAL